MDMRQKSRRNQNGQELISTKVSKFSHNPPDSEAAKFSAFKKINESGTQALCACLPKLSYTPPHLLQSKFLILDLFFFFSFEVNQSARSLSGSVRSDLILLLRSSPVAKVRSFTVAGK